MSEEIKKIVLAYSGGLDTSVILHWLKDTYKCPVVAYAADVGQVAPLGIFHVLQQAAGGAQRQVQVLAAEARQVVGLELGVQGAACALHVEFPGRLAAASGPAEPLRCSPLAFQARAVARSSRGKVGRICDAGVPAITALTPARSRPDGTGPSATPCAVTSSPMRPAGPVAWANSSRRRLSSPGARKRGAEAVTTTGSRTSTSALACPTPVSDQATAISRTVPLNSGMLKDKAARPSGNT